MSARKSINLLQVEFSYRERGMRTMLWTAAIDEPSQGKPIVSRIGLDAHAKPVRR